MNLFKVYMCYIIFYKVYNIYKGVNLIFLEKGFFYMIKRYLIFMFAQYSPLGGADDFIGSADNKEEITKIIKEKFDKNEADERINILDTKTGKTNRTEFLYRDFESNKKELLSILNELED